MFSMDYIDYQLLFDCAIVITIINTFLEHILFNRKQYQFMSKLTYLLYKLCVFDLNNELYKLVLPDDMAISQVI